MGCYSNLNFYTSKINAADSIETAPASISWFAKINMTFKIPKNFTLQVTGDYTSKTVLPPGGTAGTGGGGAEAERLAEMRRVIPFPREVLMLP